MSGVGNGRSKARPDGLPAGPIPDEVTTGVVRYIPELRAFARTLTLDPVAADDLAQEAILRALTFAQQYQPGTHFKAWLFTILRNCYFNHRRKHGRHRHYQIESLAPTAEPRVAAAQESYLRACEVRRAFERLRPHQREALMLVGPGDLSYAEAAKAVGCQVGTIKSRVARARRDLLQMLEEPAVTPRTKASPVAGGSPELFLRSLGWKAGMCLIGLCQDESWTFFHGLGAAF